MTMILKQYDNDPEAGMTMILKQYGNDPELV